MSRRKFIAPGAAYADRMDPADIIRFMKFVKVDAHGCWIWTGTTDDKGYGRFKVHGRSRWAHRVAYVNFRCPLRAGNDVHHLRACKSASCVNPQHLAQRSRDWNSLDGGRRRAAQQQAASAAIPF